MRIKSGRRIPGFLLTVVLVSALLVAISAFAQSINASVLDDILSNITRDMGTTIIPGSGSAPSGADWVFDAPLTDDLTDDYSGVTGTVVWGDTGTYTNSGGTLVNGTTDTARFEVEGLLREGAGTNKCDAINFNPADTTGVSLGGDLAATLTAVDDSVKLADAGLSTWGPNVYRLNNSAGVALAYATIDGGVGGAAPFPTHSSQIRVRGGTGKIQTNGPTTSKSFGASSDYQLVENPDWTPTADWNKFRLYVNAGQDVYFTLFQMEASGVCTTVIPNETDGVTVSRATEAGLAAGDNGVSWAFADLDDEVSDALDTGGEGTLLLEYHTPSGFCWLDNGTAYNLVSVNDSANSTLYLWKNYSGLDCKVASFDGTTVASVSCSWQADANYTMAVRWGDGTFQVGVKNATAWAWGTEQAYDGSFNPGTKLRLSYETEDLPWHAKDLKIRNEKYSTAEIEAL